MSYLLNIVISYEFSDKIFLFLKVILAKQNYCQSIKQEDENNNYKSKLKCYTSSNELIFKIIKENIFQMIFTLINLIKYSKSVVSSSHDILKILLSWSLCPANDFIYNVYVVSTI